MWVLHHCDNRLCVRPEHLHLGDNAENMREMASRGRHVPGRAKVTVSQVREARAMRLDGTPVRAIAEHLGVAYSTTRSIINRTTWKGVE
jgi:DNA invertase Pin-like site-specific DNA recombinase